jgi:methylmalonyl-CoA mutase C-terminal domain/subunit
MEVIYTPPWQDVEDVVRLAQDEDVDVVGISSLATDHLLVPGLMVALKRAHLDHVGVVVGGIVPHDEEALLIEAGVSRVFHPGSPMEEIAREVSQLAANARQQAPELLD